MQTGSFSTTWATWSSTVQLVPTTTNTYWVRDDSDDDGTAGVLAVPYRPRPTGGNEALTEPD